MMKVKVPVTPRKRRIRPGFSGHIETNLGCPKDIMCCVVDKEKVFIFDITVAILML